MAADTGSHFLYQRNKKTFFTSVIVMYEINMHFNQPESYSQ